MLFFDLDGTLLDFKGAEYAAVQSFHCEFSPKFHINRNPEDFYEEWCLAGKKHYARYLLGECSFEQQQIARVKELLGAWLQDQEAENHFGRYLKSFESHWQPFNDVIPCLERFKGERLGVITNGDLSQQRRKLERACSAILMSLWHQGTRASPNRMHGFFMPLAT